MAKKKRKITALEIVVAVLVVVAIFALIGILNLQSVSDSVQNRVGTPSAAGSSAVEVSASEAAITGNVASASVGTDLGPAEKDFQVKPE